MSNSNWPYPADTRENFHTLCQSILNNDMPDWTTWQSLPNKQQLVLRGVLFETNHTPSVLAFLSKRELWGGDWGDLARVLYIFPKDITILQIETLLDTWHAFGYSHQDHAIPLIQHSARMHKREDILRWSVDNRFVSKSTHHTHDQASMLLACLSDGMEKDGLWAQQVVKMAQDMIKVPKLAQHTQSFAQAVEGYMGQGHPDIDQAGIDVVRWLLGEGIARRYLEVYAPTALALSERLYIEEELGKNQLPSKPRVM